MKQPWPALFEARAIVPNEMDKQNLIWNIS